MKHQFKTVETRTRAGHARAVRLQASGWKVIQGSITGAVLMEKECAHASIQHGMCTRCDKKIV